MRLHHKLHKIHSKEKPDFFAAEGKKFLFLADCSSQLQGCVTFTFFTLGYNRKRTQMKFFKAFGKYSMSHLYLHKHSMNN